MLLDHRFCDIQRTDRTDSWGMDCLVVVVVLQLLQENIDKVRTLLFFYIFIMKFEVSKLTWLFVTSGEWFSCGSRWTTTKWIVIVDSALCAKSASSRTRIWTFVQMTSTILWAFRADETFRFAVWWRAKVIVLTCANCLIVHFAANTVWSAWCWTAWVFVLRWFRY